MPKRLFEYKCTDCQNIFERFTSDTNLVDYCPQCGGLSNRIISAVRCALEPFTGAFPDAYAKWERNRADKLKQERKQNA